MKKILVSLLVAVCLVAFTSAAALAGDKQRHRWQGVAIGVGAAILGHAILSNTLDPCPDRGAVVRYNDRHHYRPDRHDSRWRHEPPPRHSRSRWKVERHWVPPVCERVYNPGHYDRRGRWVAGRWITIEKKPGYWAERRIRCDRR